MQNHQSREIKAGEVHLNQARTNAHTVRFSTLPRVTQAAKNMPEQ